VFNGETASTMDSGDSASARLSATAKCRSDRRACVLQRALG